MRTIPSVLCSAHGSCDVCEVWTQAQNSSAFVRSLFLLIVMRAELRIYFRAFRLIKGILNIRRGDWNICWYAHIKKKRTNYNHFAIQSERHAHCMRNSFLVGLVLLLVLPFGWHGVVKTFLKTSRIKFAFGKMRNTEFPFFASLLFGSDNVNTFMFSHTFDKSNFWDDTCSFFDDCDFKQNPWHTHSQQILDIGMDMSDQNMLLFFLCSPFLVVQFFAIYLFPFVFGLIFFIDILCWPKVDPKQRLSE